MITVPASILARFEGRQLTIATKHGKEAVIAPLLEQALHVKCVVPQGLDTDALGTFSGEVERKDDPLTTARKKCELALKHSGGDLAVASEGSFGAHPTLFFAQADEEFVLLVDLREGLEILGRVLSTDTNFAAEYVASEQELGGFAQRAGFPDHGLILRKNPDFNVEIHKGITSWGELKNTFYQLQNRYGRAYVETDMRALYNPRRMRVIEKATHDLVEKIASPCPECDAPGFTVTMALPGLPCGLCGFPTRSTLAHVYTCQHCGATREKKYPRNSKVEEPQFCDHCNP